MVPLRLLVTLWWFNSLYFNILIWNSIADEDEEGDRITVRGDEELQAMITGVG